MPRFRIDPRRSKVEIAARSNVHPINSSSEGLEGFVDLEVQGGGKVNLHVPAKGELTLPVEQLKSGNRLEDRELQKQLDARRYPTIDGVMTGMKETGKDGRYLIEGDVSFRGVTKHMEDEMTLSMVDDDTIKLEGGSSFDIRDFGMKPPRILMLRVEPDVNVRVELFATKEH